MSSLSSSPPSPLFARSASHSSSGSGHIPLGVSNVANLLVKMRRHRKKAKEHHIESSSGDGPLTHPSLAGENVVSARKVPLEEHQTFVCRDGVDAAKLVRAVRGLLYQKALDVGANVLVDEKCVAWLRVLFGVVRTDSYDCITGGAAQSVGLEIALTGRSGST